MLVLGWDTLTLEPNKEKGRDISQRYRNFSTKGDSVPFSIHQREFVKTPREVGRIHCFQNKTRHGNGPIIVTIVTSILEGLPYDATNMNKREVPGCHMSLINKDTRQNRAQWLRQALDTLSNRILDDQQFVVTSIYVEKELFMNGVTKDNDLLTLANKFTAIMHYEGINVFIVESYPI